MGALYGSNCYPTSQVAGDAFFSSSAPSLLSGVTTVRAWFEKSSDVWMLRRQESDSNGVQIANVATVAAVPVFPECDSYETFNDGMAVGWLIVGLMLVAWSFTQIKRLIR